TTATAPAFAPPPPAPATEFAETTEEPKRPAASRRFSAGDADNWAFSYSGYFRAPMRIGISTNQGPQHTRELGTDGDGNVVNPDGDVVAHEWNGTTNTWD